MFVVLAHVVNINKFQYLNYKTFYLIKTIGGKTGIDLICHGYLRVGSHGAAVKPYI
jgi:hypothetical protein